MNKVILIRYSEIHLKGNNRHYFLKLLRDNIKNALKKYNLSIEEIPSRYVIRNFDEKDVENVISDLKKVFGIFSISVADEVDSNVDTIIDFVKGISLEGSFKVHCKRADKKFPIKSLDFEAQLGAIILDNNKKAFVDVKNPDTLVNVDIRENGKSFIFYKFIYLAGGMPLGENRDGLLLLSGGIDSPVAGYMMAKRGLRQDILHFNSYPYTSPMAKDKVVELAKIIKPYIGCRYMYIVSMTQIQEQFHINCKEEYAITLLRRSMIKIAEILAEKYRYKTIITGESLGQVASQTIEGLTLTDNARKTTPILRPLIAFNKDEIISLAKQINTFETSILPYEDCCTVFLPKQPVIKPKLDIAINEEAKIDLPSFLQNAIQNMEIIQI
ncbi:MAG: tRNA 4-thiouridine(8) synthase ThiI [Clostridia bacterium]|nr:tRNA 4-thiouridine(8) synthase ThiI [Clostridia bacterium]